MSENTVQIIVTVDDERHAITLPVEWEDGGDGTQILPLSKTLTRAGNAVFTAMASLHPDKEEAPAPSIWDV